MLGVVDDVCVMLMSLSPFAFFAESFRLEMLTSSSRSTWGAS
jgi:hypothetical protein